MSNDSVTTVSKETLLKALKTMEDATIKELSRRTNEAYIAQDKDEIEILKNACEGMSWEFKLNQRRNGKATLLRDLVAVMNQNKEASATILLINTKTIGNA